MPADDLGPVAIIGAGRMGRGLELALRAAGRRVELLPRTRRPEQTLGAALILIATPDAAVTGVAADLAREGAVGGGQVVLHLSGPLDRRALEPLAPTGAGLGSFHPLQAIADAARAPALLAGSFAGLEGDERALSAGERLASALGMRPLRLAPEAKPAYHAAAVVASNYIVVLAEIAAGIARQAGISFEDAASPYLPLMRGTVANLASGPGAALTGPVRRGDAATVRLHLAALGPEDRMLYRALGLAALGMAREAGLPADRAAEVERVLRGEEGER